MTFWPLLAGFAFFLGFLYAAGSLSPLGIQQTGFITVGDITVSWIVAFIFLASAGWASLMWIGDDPTKSWPLWDKICTTLFWALAISSFVFADWIEDNWAWYSIRIMPWGLLSIAVAFTTVRWGAIWWRQLGRWRYLAAAFLVLCTSGLTHFAGAWNTLYLVRTTPPIEVADPTVAFVGCASDTIVAWAGERLTVLMCRCDKRQMAVLVDQSLRFRPLSTRPVHCDAQG